MSAPAGAINAWQCDACDGLTVARHADEGVTPMFLACRASDDCGGRAVSLGYPSQPTPDFIVDLLAWEWYRPDSAELRTMSAEMQEHIHKGGLALRRLEDT